MKSIEIRQITTTGKASVIVVNPYLVRNIVFNMIQLQKLAEFLRNSLRHDAKTDEPVFADGIWVPAELLDPVYHDTLQFFETLDNGICHFDDEE